MIHIQSRKWRMDPKVWGLAGSFITRAFGENDGDLRTGFTILNGIHCQNYFHVYFWYLLLSPVSPELPINPLNHTKTGGMWAKCDTKTGLLYIAIVEPCSSFAQFLFWLLFLFIILLIYTLFSSKGNFCALRPTSPCGLISALYLRH